MKLREFIELVDTKTLMTITDNLLRTWVETKKEINLELYDREIKNIKVEDNVLIIKLKYEDEG